MQDSKVKNISGPHIRAMRKALGWQQIDLAVALGVEHGLKLEQSDISEIERQVRSVKDFELDAIAHVLNTNPLLLLRGSQP